MGTAMVYVEGERIPCSFQVERSSHPEAIVVPVPDPAFGARPLVFVAGSRCWEHLAQELKKALPRFMVPAGSFLACAYLA